MRPEMRNGSPPDTESRPEESSGRIKHSVPPSVVVWGVVEVDLGPHTDPYGWIKNIPVGTLPYPPAGALVRIRIGDAQHVSPLVFCHLAQTIPAGCRVEVCGSRGNTVADVVTGLRAAFTRLHMEGAA